MVGALIVIAALALISQALIGLSYFISCIWERERRASFYAGVQFMGMTVLFIAFLYLSKGVFFQRGLGLAILIAGYVFGALGAILFLPKFGKNPRALEGTKGLVNGEVKRIDEREQVFARNRTLRPGSKEYERFYKEHPEYEEFDKKRRKKGGPLGTIGSIDGKRGSVNVEATLACVSIPQAFSTPDKCKPQPAFNPMYQPKSDQPRAEEKKYLLSPEEATERIKGYTLRLGADLVGIAEIDPLWTYSRKGEIFNDNWEDWGKEIIPDKYAIVFAMEMDFAMVGAAPHTPTVIESMRNYAKGAFIATQLAGFIANLGYPASANHLRHYEALMVPLAVDAGLGEMGRMGYLLTKEYGPRVRLGAVTTELPLIPDNPVDLGVEDFCKICKKCAVCCPSNSIPLGEQKVVNGTLRWKLNDETCFDYWGKIGTDCNICMRVCPFSHARTFPHKLIVELITRNKYARRLFSYMDDIFYGPKPKRKSAPAWARLSP
jgi:reductive dehalogenase